MKRAAIRFKNGEVFDIGTMDSVTDIDISEKGFSQRIKLSDGTVIVSRNEDVLYVKYFNVEDE